MKSYIIRFDPVDRNKVLELVRNFSNDVIIDRVEDDEIGVTVQLDEVEADLTYNDLRYEVEEMLESRERHFTD